MNDLQADLLAWVFGVIAGLSLYLGVRPIALLETWNARRTAIAVVAAAVFFVSLDLARQRPDGWIVWSLGVIAGSLMLMARCCAEAIELWVQSR